ncbi:MULTISPECIES: hypothetical protein [Burkholderiaceae]|uniref:Uncharacterized protein n=1 Tax=Paraburkholderia phytofirmans (strain DSM 17436 / LMG 22146 / PsJN) TaxID=398527 RepID=B2THA3_PARPJ|nr:MULTISPECIES: hypothetical protein [Burkholderiaceae]ACD21652.1 hypothetical protein Bphyt_7367 [Paraburkholderia phytofirmans PsJN]
MKRNSKQEAALRRKYAAKRDDTRTAFERALSKIAEDPLAVLTEKSLYVTADRSRATLNRYPDIKARLAALRDERQRTLGDSVQRATLSAESAATARLVRVQGERDAMAQRVAILSLALQDLERRNASLVRLLRKHRIAVPLELVAGNNRDGNI